MKYRLKTQHFKTQGQTGKRRERGEGWEIFKRINTDHKGDLGWKCGAQSLREDRNVVDETNIRERILLPQQFGLKSLINRLLFAFGPSASLAAVHYFGTLHFVIPGPRQDVAGRTVSVPYNARYLKTPGKTTKLWQRGADILTDWYLINLLHQCCTICGPPNMY